MVGKSGKTATAAVVTPKSGGRAADPDAKAEDYPNDNWAKFFPKNPSPDGAGGSGKSLTVPVAFRVRVTSPNAQLQKSLTLVLEYSASQFLLKMVPKEYVIERPGPGGDMELAVRDKDSLPADAVRVLPAARSRAPTQRYGDVRWVQVCFSVSSDMADMLGQRLRADGGQLNIGHGMRVTALIGDDHIRLVRMRDVPMPDTDLLAFLVNSGRSGAYPFTALEVRRVWTVAGTSKFPTNDVDIIISCPDGATPPMRVYLLAGRQEGRTLELLDPEPTALPHQVQRLATAIALWRAHGGPPPPNAPAAAAGAVTGTPDNRPANKRSFAEATASAAAAKPSPAPAGRRPGAGERPAPAALVAAAAAAAPAAAGAPAPDQAPPRPSTWIFGAPAAVRPRAAPAASTAATEADTDTNMDPADPTSGYPVPWAVLADCLHYDGGLDLTHVPLRPYLLAARTAGHDWLRCDDRYPEQPSGPPEGDDDQEYGPCAWDISCVPVSVLEPSSTEEGAPLEQ